jgi:hypothetical protein
MTSDLQARLYERHEKRVDAGAKRYLEQKRKAEADCGFGGVKLTRQEKADLYLQAALDPMGVQMSEILMRRQQANKLGPGQLPADFVSWDIENWAKHQEGSLMPEGEAMEQTP